MRSIHRLTDGNFDSLGESRPVPIAFEINMNNHRRPNHHTRLTRDGIYVPEASTIRTRRRGALESFRVHGWGCLHHVEAATDPYQGKFEVTDFIGSISEKLIAQSKADNERKSSLYFMI